LIAFFNLVNQKIQLGYSENLFGSAMEFIQSRVEPWMREQGARLMKVSWGPLQWRMKWPWTNHREQKKRIKEEYQRRRKQLNDLCLALKTDSLSDLQDLLCCMVLSECVYKVFLSFVSISFHCLCSIHVVVFVVQCFSCNF
jgi:hypothetical protein